MDKIRLTKGMIAQVDGKNFERLDRFKWNAMKPKYVWYACRREGSKTILMHREIMNAPDGIKVDHIDGDGLHNWEDNLRLATHAQNMAHRGKTRANTSGYKGVTWHERGNTWQAQITIDGQGIFLGSFADPANAARMYDQAAQQAFGEFAVLNFPLNKL